MTICALFLALLCSAQLAPPFQMFDPDDFPSGYFLPAAQVVDYKLPSGDAFEPLTYLRSRASFNALKRAEVNGDLLPDEAALETMKLSYLESVNALPISIVQLRYARFDEDAIAEGDVAVIGGTITLDAPVSQVVEHTSCFFLQLPMARYSSDSYRFIFPEEAYFTNEDLTFTSLEVDFDDGIGWQPLVFDEVYAVHYQNQQMDRTVRVRLQHTGGTFRAAAFIKSSGAASSFPNPELPPWYSGTSSAPWLLTADYGNETISGNAYTLLSEDGVFDRPFIFVEGIDFGKEITPLRNGSFGWYEFSSGQSTEYPFLYNMPVLLNLLRAEGYDIILLDFTKGADFIQKNAALLKHLIQLCNDYKAGAEELVIAGASMGGQVSRIALREMELAGQPHCTRVWISLDSPHTGANIPLGLQRSLYFLSDHFAAAEVFVADYLETPAARQLLIYQVGEVPSLYNEYFAYAESIGYPKECRNVAIANGSSDATPLPVGNGVPLIDYECSFFGSPLFKLYFTTLPGDPYNDQSTPDAYLLTDLHVSDPQGCIGLNCLMPFILSVDEEQTYVSPDSHRLDNCPGGTRSSIEQLVEAIEAALAESSDLPSWCTTSVNNYYSDHSFIPTVSALGIDAPYHSSVTALLQDSPESCPFDRWYAPTGTNLQHSEISNAMIDLVLEEVVDGAPMIGGWLNGEVALGYFNYGVPYQYQLPEVWVSQGGELYVNADLPLHYGDDPDWYSEPASTMLVRTPQCETEVTIGAEGLFEIGSGTGSRNGRVEIRKGSTLRMIEGSVVRLLKASELVIRNGATLKIEGGKLEINEGSRVIIEEGAQLIYAGDEPIYVSDPGSALVLRGTLTLDENHDLTIQALENHTNGVVVFESSGVNVIGDGNAQLHLLGSGTGDELLHIAEGAELMTSAPFGLLRVRDGNVTLANHAKIATTGECQFFNAQVNGDDETVGFHLFSAALFNNCRLMSTDLVCDLNNDLLRFKNSELYDCSIDVDGGSYRVEESELHSSSLFSIALQFNARIVNSIVTGPEQLAIHDQSSTDLRIVNSAFSHLGTAVRKRGGTLELKCNSFSTCGIATVTAQFCTLSMTTADNTGYNVFEDNGVHCFFLDATDVHLTNGYNQFLSFNNHLFEGTLFGSCTAECTAELFATGNYWGGGSPIANSSDLHYLDPYCDIDAWYNPYDGFTVTVVDKLPIEPIACDALPAPPVDAVIAGKALFDESSFELSPNPARSTVEVRFGIQSSDAAGPTLRIFDMSGQLIDEHEVQRGAWRHIFDLSELRAGIYIIECVLSDGKRLQRRLIVAP